MMKLLKGFLVLASVLFLQTTFAQSPKAEVVLVPKGETQVLSYTVQVMSIIDSKCFGCHQPDARSEDAKEALQWEQLQTMEKPELMDHLDEILEVLEEGSMPPEKIVAKYPNMELTDEEITILKEWAESKMKDTRD